MAKVSTLLVDDDADIRRLARMVLEEAERCLSVVGEAETGQEALDLVDRCDPDVVVLDLAMPGWDGLETARAIHMDHPDQPIIIWSAYLTPAARRAARDQGIASCVEKGDLRHLAAEIRRVGRRPAAEPGTTC